MMEKEKELIVSYVQKWKSGNYSGKEYQRNNGISLFSLLIHFDHKIPMLHFISALNSLVKENKLTLFINNNQSYYSLNENK